MRIDKYLKVSRLIKRRTVAKEVAEASRILVNGNLAKPSKEIKVSDVITIEFGTKIVNIRVLSIDEKTKKDLSSTMYELISEEKKEIKY